MTATAWRSGSIPTHAAPIRMRRHPCAIRSSWWAAGRSAWRPRSTSGCRACRSSFSTITRASGRAAARSVSPSARSRSATGWGCGEADARQGRRLEPRQGLSRGPQGVRVQPPARGRAPLSRLHQPPAALFRALPRGARPCRRRSEGAPIEIRGKNRVDAVEMHGRPRAARRDDARGAVPHRRRLADRLRRRVLTAARDAGPRFRGARLQGQLPHRRHPDDAPTSRPSAGSGSSRRSSPPAPRACCTSSPTASGASISRSAGTSTARPR